MKSIDFNIKPHDRFSCVHILTTDTVTQMADILRVNNQTDHSQKFASPSLLKSQIVSDSHLTSLLLVLTASYFPQNMTVVSLDYQLFFKQPIYLEETITLEWLVIRVTTSEKLRGIIVDLRGRILGQNGNTSLGAKGQLLITEKLNDSKWRHQRAVSITFNTEFIHRVVSRKGVNNQILQEQLAEAEQNHDDFLHTNSQLSSPLTNREIEVLQEVAQGLTNKEISRRLNISEHTVKSHIIHMFDKLGVNDRTQASVWAVKHGLL